MLQEFIKNTAGSFLQIAAIGLPMILGVTGVSLDYYSYYNQTVPRQRLWV